MILNVSGRTDIVAFYTQWFMNRYQEGFLDVRNPFYPKKVSRIYFEDVDLILFCTKNPIPILDYIQKIEKPILFHITVTPYFQNIEPNVPPKGTIIKAIQQLSSMIGADSICVRYDPILISEQYTVEYHKKAFNHLCSLLNSYVKTIIVSFIDDYKNVRKNQDVLKAKPFREEDEQEIGVAFSNSARRNGMTVQTCCEEKDLSAFGFVKGECISKTLANQLTGKKFKSWKARNCNCAEMVDVGSYNSCRHLCKYCYANYDEKRVEENFQNHDVHSSLLIGQLQEDDLITRRK